MFLFFASYAPETLRICSRLRPRLCPFCGATTLFPSVAVDRLRLFLVPVFATRPRRSLTCTECSASLPFAARKRLQ